MGSMLSIKLLGRFSIEVDGEPVRGVSSRKAEALLIYLVCQKRPFSREVLADFLWDDRPQDQSLANLRSLLSGLRRHLGQFLDISRQTVAFKLDSEYYLDVDAFLEHLQPLRQEEAHQMTPLQIAAVETAVSIYEGAFLEGFHIRDSRRFEEWVTVERERLQRLAVMGWQQLVQHYIGLGNYAVGIEHVVRILETDPLNEHAHRLMMTLLAKNNQRHTALQQYEACVRLLEEELGVPPALETTRLFEHIRSSQTSPLHNLPGQSTPFVGRDSELADLGRILEEPNGRFITLLGPGGIGKTRLAHQFAQRIVDRQPGLFLHGLRFIALASLESASYFATTIANGIGYQLRGSETPEQQLVAFLKDREMLLIIDNFDHLAESETAVQLLSTLIQQCPLIKILVTSRVRLHLPEETVFDMRGLQFPRRETAVAVENYSAVQLFIQNARRYLRAFQPSQEDLEAIVQTCRMLDGVPLGIELASAWVRFLSCDEIVADLSQNLQLLEEADGAGSSQSLKAAFDRSWTLLTDVEGEVLCKLSLFRTPFDRDAAKAVGNASLGNLVRLMDSSWLRRVTVESDVRFDMLTITRQYCNARLDEMATVRETAVQAFTTYYGNFLAQRQDALKGGRQRETLTEIGVEIDNIRFCMELALEKQMLEVIGKGIDSLFYYHDTRSQFLAGSALFQRLVDGVEQFADSPEKQVVHAKLQARLGWFLFHLGQYHASRHLLESSLKSMRAEDAEAEMVFVLNYLGAATRHFGEYDAAEALLDEALTLAKKHEDVFGGSIALNILGQVASLQGDYASARELCEQSRQLKASVGDQWGMNHSLTYLGRVALALGEHDEAQTLFEQSLAISEAFADRRGMAFAHQNLGDVALGKGKGKTAVSQYDQSLFLYREIADRLGLAMTQAKLGQALSLTGAEQRARRALVESLVMAQELASAPAMMEGVLGTAVLQQMFGERETAVDRLRFVFASDESNQAQKERAAHLLSQLNASNEGEPQQGLSDYVKQILAHESNLVVS